MSEKPVSKVAVVCRRLVRSELGRELQDMLADTVLQLVVLLQIYVVGAATSALVPTDDVKARFHWFDEHAGLAMLGFIALRALARLYQRTFRTRDRRQ